MQAHRRWHRPQQRTVSVLYTDSFQDLARDTEKSRIVEQTRTQYSYGNESLRDFDEQYCRKAAKALW